ncbi:MAG: nucleotidyltransferase family protein [Thermoanaerobaculia bacterium]|nr:nucleotidyltransferase family protein [Thermoanaerobaculia bacterium]
MSGIGPFRPDEVERLLGDPGVAAAGLAALEAIRVSSLAPLAALAEAGGLTRETAFAASVQGLAPRLATLPGGEELDVALRLHLEAESARGAERGDRILALLDQLAALIGASGLRAVPLKGAALVLGGDVPAGLRPMADVDLLFESEPDLRRAAGKIGEELGYVPLWNTPRHLVLAEREERVALQASEHPGNPLRIELHRSFRLDVLGRRLDATESLLRDTVAAAGWEVPGPEAMLRHLLFHAAEDFAAKGLRGVQAVDFLVLSRRSGPLPMADLPAASRAPVVLAARAIEEVFPGTFDAAALGNASARLSALVLRRAAALPVLRHSRAATGWTATALGLCEGASAKARFLARTLLPSLDEVKANVAPGTSGLRLAAVWLKVLIGRLASGARLLSRR